jgi:hypothetical protein
LRIFLVQTRLPSAVPVSRTNAKDEPQVYPSSFVTAGSSVQPIEPVRNGEAGVAVFPYGPRSLHVDAIEKRDKEGQEEAKEDKATGGQLMR